ncbi:NAD(P)-binding protein [Annulohypoxylon maeteangense]|uniref:NAD(P)-binding protein n=1 Tax=Annulohypoxylon maeteangense TaxID=1927788 RepID=UPI002008BEAF|nr:NAD(P)-binding protein [Annulohypoxylon maeteangense]KAI0882117.1 NAD(P)-binding protein [Annulohypoxylon maeteangense]
MSVIKKVAVFGAAGNFGTPITAALVTAGFQVTIITRIESDSTFPDGIPVIRTEYTVEKLTTALTGQDAAVSVIGPGGLHVQVALIDAAEAAGIKRFIVDDFGWGPNFNSLPEFREIGTQRRAAYDHAKKLSQTNPNFTYTGVTIGNPIDWAIKRFPLMGFDVKQRSAVIYDDGTVEFTGTTLEGIAQAIVGVLKHPDETANRHVKARSIQVSQNKLLDALQRASGQSWEVKRGATSDLLESGREKHQSGVSGWVLELLVYQLFGPGGRCIVASKEDSDADLLEIKEESPDDIARKVLGSIAN